jgi:CheY-like chemotaxis protein
MDLVMPNTGGIELFAEMLADPTLRRIPVVTMSGLKVDMRLPSRAHLEKPFGLAELVEALRAATGESIAFKAEPRVSRGR